MPHFGWLGWKPRSYLLKRTAEDPAFVHPPETLQPRIPVFNNSSTIAEMSQYHANSFNTNSFNNVWNSFTVTDDRSQLLTWLSPLEPRLRHQDIQERRVDDIGNGSCKPKNSEVGMIGVGKVKAVRRSCLAMETRGLVKHSSGDKYYFWEEKRKS